MVKFKLSLLGNGTFLTSLLDSTSEQFNVSSVEVPLDEEYDNQGALYYVVIVVFLYGFSIVLMIGSSLRKSKKDGSVTRYMSNLDKIRR